jgi:hypothetical protein
MSTRKEYIESLRTKLDETNAAIRELEGRILAKTAEDAERYRIKAVKELHREAQNKLVEIENAAEDAWEHFKEGAEVAWNAVKESLSKAKADFQ